MNHLAAYTFAAAVICLAVGTWSPANSKSFMRYVNRHFRVIGVTKDRRNARQLAAARMLEMARVEFEIKRQRAIEAREFRERVARRERARLDAFDPARRQAG